MKIFRERNAAICGGTVSGLLPLIGADELFRTLILAGAGAVISFIVSYTLHRILPRKEEPRAKQKQRRQT